MPFHLISLGTSIFVLSAVAIYFFYWQYLKRKNYSLLALSKRSEWVEPMLEIQKEERLEENIVDEMITTILPPAKSKRRSTRHAKPPCDYEVISLYILPLPNRSFHGYEFLQAIAVNDFHYGKMRIFHRHEKSTDTESPVLFSLANAVEPGFFNLSEMGSFNCAGLILFMRLDTHADHSAEHFHLMLDTAKQLAEDLDGAVFDDARNPFNAAAEKRYLKRLGSS